ncbi:MAG TPA: YdeI/OmpD-associated family protein [Flavobacteriales bacterium]|nr:YdeI/OmpD-associated family protein [Flavobacteriales bacterium]
MPVNKPFKTKVKRFTGTGTWTYADIPFNCEKAFGKKGAIKVKATANKKTVDASLMPHGNGKHFIILNKKIRDVFGIEEGDLFELSIVINTKPTALKIPAELEKALNANKTAKANFDAMPPSHKKEYIGYITEARKEETRMNRIVKTIEMLEKQKNL